MKRVVAVAVVLGLVVLGGVALAGDGEARRRGSGARTSFQALPGSDASRAEARAALRTAVSNQVPRVAWTGACRTLRCINNRLNLLKTGVNRAQARFNALNSCLFIQGMSS